MAEQGSEGPVGQTPDDVFSVSRDPILVYDLDAREVVDANDAAVELLGYDRHAIIGAGIEKFSPNGTEFTESRAKHAVEVGIETGEHRFEWRIERRDGSRRWVDVSLKRATLNGEARLLAFVRDVTEQRRLTERLREGREALRRLHEVTVTDQSMASMIDSVLEIGTEYLGLQYGYLAEIDADTQRIRRSLGGHEQLEADSTAPRAESFCRHTLSDPEGVGVFGDVAAELPGDPAVDRFGLTCYIGATILVDGEEYGTICFAGEQPRHEGFTEAEQMFVDTVARWIGSEIEDERRTAELAARQRQLEVVFDTPASFVGLLDPDGTLRRANRSAREIVGCAEGELAGRPFWECPWFDHEADLQRRMESYVKRAAEGETVDFEATHYTVGDKPIDVEGTIRPITDDTDEVELLVAHGIDVTKRKRRLEEVRQHRQRLQAVLDNAPLVLFSLDADGVFTQSRGAALESLGLEPGEAIGMSAFDLYADFPTVVDSIERALDGEQVETEVAVGGEYFQTVLNPVTDDDGTLQEVIGVSQQVTSVRRREQELRRSNEQMEFFNSILQHDMLNGMNVIKMRAELLEESLSGEDASQAATIVDWSDNIIDLTDKVRSILDTLTAEEEPELEPTALAPLIEDEVRRVRGKAGNVEVTTDLPEDTAVIADPLLSDVFGNLLTNAVEHTLGKAVNIRVEATREDGTVRTVISDDGPGVPPNQREQVFERGQTGNQSTGTGFGLYFVDAMVETYGGSVTVEESDRGGARFVLELPVAT